MSGRGAACAPFADEAQDLDEADSGAELLPAEEMPIGHGAVAVQRRLLLRAGSAALIAGALVALAAFCALRPPVTTWAPRPHVHSVQDGFEAELSVKQQQGQYVGGAYDAPTTGYGYSAPAPAPVAGGELSAPGGVAMGGASAGYPVAGSTAAATPAYGGTYGDAVPAAPAAAAAGRGPSFYCFALTMPAGGEVKLLRYQLKNRVSLFLCDDYQIFSNESFAIGPDTAKGGALLMTIPIGMSLKVPTGGRWGTALNTDVFVQTWQTVAQEARWQNYDWSCKLDADAVFLPERLRAMVRPMPNPGPKYLNNCKWGLHGPIEVISRHGLQVYFANSQAACEQIREDAMEWQPVHWNEQMQRWTGTDKEHSFGEDQFLRRCLRLLHVTEVNEYRLLDELACGGKPKQTGCVGNYVTYHPFKEVEGYETCLEYAQAETPQMAR